MLWCLNVFLLILSNILGPLCPGDAFTITAQPVKSPFLFGVATASYQVEGAFDEDGRGLSVWDEFTHRDPSPIFDKSNGDIASDSYHQLDRDLELIRSLGVQTYRFSISWSRILPTGEANHINQAGVAYYNRLINGLLAMKVIPFVTMFHWDTPLTLQRQFGGFANKVIVHYFEDYAKVLFQQFGDRVKNWMTFNEPNVFCGDGYGSDTAAPGMNFRGVGDYLCMHHVILSHALVYHMYQREFKDDQNGAIGITLNNRFAFEKGTGSEVIDRFMTFTLGWKMDPLFDRPFHGYPEDMNAQIKRNSDAEGRSHSRLPEFAADEEELFQGKVVDFLGLNYYTSRIVSPGLYSPDAAPSYDKDLNVTVSVDSEWIRAKSSWLYSVPEGLYHLLLWIKQRYNSPLIYITENGWSDEGETNDLDRVNYLQDHLHAVKRAVTEGVDVRGYFHWSLMDNFEWERGYSEKFGLFKVNFTDPHRSCQMKHSTTVYKAIIAKGFDLF